MEKSRITPELLKKAEKAQTPEELMELAKAEGIELTLEEAEKALARLQTQGELSDEELDNVAGGGCGKWKVKGKNCRKCGTQMDFRHSPNVSLSGIYRCPGCGHTEEA